MKYILITILIYNAALIADPLESPVLLSKEIDIEDKVLESLTKKLLSIGIVRSGSFTLKNGSLSPYYIDLRCVISYPNLLIEMSDLIHKKLTYLSFDTLCGVPYGALAVTSAISIRHNIPMIFIRKEKKSYGMGQMIEGIVRDNDTVVIIEDVITTGESIAKIVKILRSHGLVVRDAIVFLDREEGGKQYLELLGVQVHSVITISKLLTATKT